MAVLKVSVCVCRDKTYRVAWVRHGIERSHSQWVFIQHVEVSIILRQQGVDENNQSLSFKRDFQATLDSCR